MTKRIDNCIEIIKPILRGRDIHRYRSKQAGMWLIYSHSAVSEDQYPKIREYLLPHKEKLLARRGGYDRRKGTVPYEWWQLQIDYFKSGAYKNFFDKKLFWMDMSEVGRFSYSEEELFCNDKGYIMTGDGESLKYLCAILNSTLITWMVKNITLTTGVGLPQWKKFVVESLPIPKISAEARRPFIRLIDKILTIKADNTFADTSPSEFELDKLTSRLYGLTYAETQVLVKRKLIKN